jgi:hypothetical protein
MDMNTDDSLLLRLHRSLSIELLADGATASSSSIRRRLLFSTAFWVAFGLVGWYYPRYLIAYETAISTKAAPYQQTAAGDVLLDFTLNEAVVEPPTISCTC